MAVKKKMLDLAPKAVNQHPVNKKLCFACNEQHPLERHHIIPITYGGMHSPLVDLCRKCHNDVHSIAASGMEHSNPVMEVLALYIQRAHKATEKSKNRALTIQVKLPGKIARKLAELANATGKSKREILCKGVEILHTQKLK